MHTLAHAATAALLAMAAAGAAPPASAQAGNAADGAPRQPQIQLGGVMGSKALFVIDGQSQMIAVGDTVRGVRLVSLNGDVARIELQGKPMELRVGSSPVVVGGAIGGGGGGPGASTREIVIPVGDGGHFVVDGTINGHAVRFLVDTGATTVSLGRADAARLGLDLRKGRLGLSGTANGVTQVVTLTLDSVRIGGVELYNVPASVLPNSMPVVLLGNSFLSRFQISHDNQVMRLTRRY